MFYIQQDALTKEKREVRLPSLGVVCWLVGSVAGVVSDLVELTVAVVFGR
jgi:hypothetical protein